MKIGTRQGQQIIEFMLLFVVVVVILLVFVRPNGLYERAVDNTLNMAFNVMGQQKAVP